MVIKQLLELTGAGPWEQKDGTFYLASLLSMNLCSKEKCWSYETRSATEIIYEHSVITTTFFFTLLLQQTEVCFHPISTEEEWMRLHLRWICLNMQMNCVKATTFFFIRSLLFPLQAINHW